MRLDANLCRVSVDFSPWSSICRDTPVIPIHTYDFVNNVRRSVALTEMGNVLQTIKVLIGL